MPDDVFRPILSGQYPVFKICNTCSGKFCSTKICKLLKGLKYKIYLHLVDVWEVISQALSFKISFFLANVDVFVFYTNNITDAI